MTTRYATVLLSTGDIYGKTFHTPFRLGEQQALDQRRRQRTGEATPVCKSIALEDDGTERPLNTEEERERIEGVLS